MKKKKATYNQKSRQDISSKNHSVPYSTLLERAKVKIFTSTPVIEKLENGRIVVREAKSDDAKCIKSNNIFSSEATNSTTKKIVKKPTKKAD